MHSACERAGGWISLELDGELSEFELAALGRHVEGCPRCRELRGELGALTRVLRSQPSEPPARALVLPRLIAARRRSRRAGGALAALAACAALAWAVVLRSPATPPAEAVGSLSAIQVPRFVHAEQHWGVARVAAPHPLSLEGMLLVVHARV